MSNLLRKNTPKTTIIVGAGGRGLGYPMYAQMCPDRFKVVGVCEPRDYHRNIAAKTYNIPEKYVFKDWKDAVSLEKFADSVIICTPDRLHKICINSMESYCLISQTASKIADDPAIAFAKKGYHILLEKPMSVTEKDCRDIVGTCKSNGVILSVCHVLRYTPWVKKVKEIIDSGIIGEVVNINHTEPVGFWHFAHSYVRGNWHKEETSSFSLLAKCCHDVDLICHWMSNRKCERVSSFGHLSHFTKADKPKGAASRCIDCPSKIESQCPYSAKKIYLDDIKSGYTGWPVCVICEGETSIKNVREALKTGPYGKCVYDMDNDVMSHQVVNMQFEGGATATLTMVAFTKRVCAREVKIYGTKGEMVVKDGNYPPIHVYEFITGKTTPYTLVDDAAEGPLGGHGGADFHTIEAFVNKLHDPQSEWIVTGPENTLASHVLCFAAETARKENRVLNRNSDGLYV